MPSAVYSFPDALIRKRLIIDVDTRDISQGHPEYVLSVTGQRRLRIPSWFLAPRESKSTRGNFSDSVC